MNLFTKLKIFIEVFFLNLRPLKKQEEVLEEIYLKKKVLIKGVLEKVNYDKKRIQEVKKIIPGLKQELLKMEQSLEQVKMIKSLKKEKYIQMMEKFFNMERDLTKIMNKK